MAYTPYGSCDHFNLLCMEKGNIPSVDRCGAGLFSQVFSTLDILDSLYLAPCSVGATVFELR